MIKINDTQSIFKACEKLSNPNLINNLLEAVDSQLVAKNNDLKLLKLKADLNRKAGFLKQARTAYSDFCQQAQLSLDKGVSFTQAFNEMGFIPTTSPKMNQNAITPVGLTSSKGEVVAPFLVFDDFLTPEQSHALLSYAHTNQSKFELAGMGGRKKEFDLTKRFTYKLALPAELKKYFFQQGNIALDALCHALNIPAFEVDKMDMKMTNHLNQGFFNTHKDNDALFGSDTGRVFTCLYYFNQEPKYFSGGDLYLFDSNLKQQTFNTQQFSKISPKHNQLVVFPSCFYHGVSPVEMPDNNFMKGRFAISAHAHFKFNLSNNET
jgi:Rps23 Pro-64 3,4-dihydroxylase Tpa1-like proline 4-hydroxylase